MSEGTIQQVLAGEAQWAVVHSDCLDVLRELPDECVDAVVTDAPYGLSKITEENVRDALACWLRGEPYLSKSKGFMGRSWDRFVPGPEVWRECCRVLRPGGYLLTFAGTRTDDLMGIALRLGGLERVDTLAWLHGQGFPKSVNLEREVAMYQCTMHGRHFASTLPKGEKLKDGDHLCPETEESRRWKGYGSALKPSHEPVICARKPLTAVPPMTILEEAESLLGGLLCQCLLCAKSAELLSSSSPRGQRAPVSALILAAVIHGASSADWQERMGTYSSPEMVETCLSIGKSWSVILDASLDRQNTFTTETAIEVTTALRTLRFLISEITPGSIIRAVSSPAGQTQSASTAGSCSSDGPSSLTDTLKHIAAENATSLPGSKSASTAGQNTAHVARVVASVLENVTTRIAWQIRTSPKSDPILVCRKPLRGTYAENVLMNGTAMSIDACRVAHANSADFEQHKAGVDAIKARGGVMGESWANASDLSGASDVTSAGRWPPNVVIQHSPGCRRVGTRSVAANPTWDTPNRDTEPSAFTGETVSRVRHGRAGQASAERRYDEAGSTSFAPLPGDRLDVEDVEVWSCVEGCAAKALGEMSGELTSGNLLSTHRKNGVAFSSDNPYPVRGRCGEPANFGGDAGTATRFFPQFPSGEAPYFYQSKPSRHEKDAGLQHFRPRTAAEATHSEDDQQRLESPRTGAGRTGGARNPHPTSKSVDLIRWITRLAARPGQVVLNPFAGGGSEGVAALLEGVRWIGIELNDTDEEPFVSIARARLTHIDGHEFIPRESLRAPEKDRPRQVSLFAAVAPPAIECAESEDG